jgi:proprotein convertase subtilisin/kexin type 5
MDGFFLLPTTSECLKTCPDGFWGDIAMKQCIRCTPPCSKCKNDKVCLNCIKDFFLFKDFPEYNCLSTCPEGFYADILTGGCKECNSTCATCESDKLCNSCKKGFLFYRENRECLSKCPSGFFVLEGSSSCTKCATTCKTCETKAEVCTSCNKNLFLDSNLKACMDKCPDGFYGDIADNICKACDKTCLTCKGKLENNCLSCDLKRGIKFIMGYC